MKNLIVTRTSYGKIEVLDFAMAFHQDLIHSHDLLKGDANTEKLVQDLSEAAPNLALNVKNASAPSSELWAWAAVGILLQAAAMGIRGVTTYFWKWDKAGVPVPQYGYPCFIIGTVLVMLGVIACGHVIEGITTEHYFTPGTMQPGGVFQSLVRIQRSCTVSGQHFGSFGIYNSDDDLRIRISRLNKPEEQNYR